MLKMSKVFDILEELEESKILKGGMVKMELPLILFLSVTLAIFAALDIGMIVTLLRPGDERSQIIVWKAGNFTLLGMVGTNVLDVAESLIRSQPMTLNPFVQLEVMAIIYFVSLLYYRRKHGG